MKRPIAVFGAALMVLTVGCRSEDVYESSTSYSVRGDAVKDGAFQRGWLPSLLPLSAHNITESHVIDSGEVWIEFYADRADIDNFVAGCSKEEGHWTSVHRARGRAEWWAQRVKREGRLEDGARHYRCPGMMHGHVESVAGVIVSSDRRRVWYVKLRMDER